MADRQWRKPVADVTDNVYARDVIGNKTDAAVGTGTTTKSIMAYTKGILEDTGTTLPATLATILAGIITGTGGIGERVATSATAVMVNGDTIFTIAGGPIEVLALFSECITDNDATASTVQYSFTDAVMGAATISAASGSIASSPIGSMVTCQLTALSTAALYASEGATIYSTGPSKILLQPGAITVVIGVGSTTGTWKHYLRYKPYAVGVTVV